MMHGPINIRFKITNVHAAQKKTLYRNFSCVVPLKIMTDVKYVFDMTSVPLFVYVCPYVFLPDKYSVDFAQITSKTRELKRVAAIAKRPLTWKCVIPVVCV